jgi:M6 family metalloprotease-like protein
MRIKVSIAEGLLIALALALVPIAATSAPKITPGSSCKVIKQKVTSQNKVYTCIKSGKKLVWSKGVIVAKPTPKPTPTPTAIGDPPGAIGGTPTPTPTPAPVKDVSNSPTITDSKLLSSSDICKIGDLSPRSDTSNGFPRPNGIISGSGKATVLLLPISFSDQVFGENDLASIRKTLDEVERFYKNTSYGKFTLTFEIPEKKNWISMSGTADSYGLVNIRPQQNNSALVEQIFLGTNPELDFSKYDAVILETKLYPASGGGQGFPSMEFRTANGTAKRVSFEFGSGAGKLDVIAHELGHTLFNLEDLYVFLNSNRPSVPDPSPAGSWDMMSNSAPNFFGWSKYLIGWLGDDAVNCITDQSSVTQYLTEIDASDSKRKLLLIQSAPGVVMGVEVRSEKKCREKERCLGLLIYTVDTNINHGDGPIVARKELLFVNESVTVGKYQFKVEDFDENGLLFTVNRV